MIVGLYGLYKCPDIDPHLLRQFLQRIRLRDVRIRGKRLLKVFRETLRIRPVQDIARDVHAFIFIQITDRVIDDHYSAAPLLQVAGIGCKCAVLKEFFVEESLALIIDQKIRLMKCSAH